MASSKTSLVVLVLVLVALVALYLVGVGVGASGVGAPPSRERRAELRQKLLGELPPVEREQLGATGCGADPRAPVIAANGTCALAIAESGERLRMLQLATSDGLDVRFVPRGAPHVPIELELRRGRDNAIELPIAGDGATLTLECRQPGVGAFCRATLR